LEHDQFTISNAKNRYQGDSAAMQSGPILMDYTPFGDFEALCFQQIRGCCGIIYPWAAFKATMRTDRAAGVMPSIREACPKDVGCTRLNLSFNSLDRPWTELKSNPSGREYLSRFLNRSISLS
jgi:hypothetical protein